MFTGWKAISIVMVLLPLMGLAPAVLAAQNPFVGRWVSVDTYDGSSQWMTV